MFREMFFAYYYKIELINILWSNNNTMFEMLAQISSPDSSHYQVILTMREELSVYAVHCTSLLISDMYKGTRK